MSIRRPLLAGIRTVALFEAAKGGAVLLAGLGLLTLLHRDAQTIAERLVRHSHLNPASHYPRIFIEAAGQLTDVRLWWLAAGAALYALVRAIEAVGLWYERRWAEWFALASSALYLPVEIYEVYRHATWIRAAILAVNATVVVAIGFALLHARDQELERQEAESAP